MQLDSSRANRTSLRGLLLSAVVLIFGTGSVAAQTQQSTFASAEEAVSALKAAVDAKDLEALRKIFGPALKDLCSGDEVQDKADLIEFSERLAQQHKIVPEGEERATLEIGREAHPFAIPLVRKEGKWYFDTEAGKEEVLNRRVGENELGAIRVCRGYVVAQFEYYSEDRDNDDVLEFAQTFASSPGKRDGLYWATKPDEPMSPLGPAVAQARAEGYSRTQGSAPQPYHGYVYRLLTRQGDRAPGGKVDYVINGNMLAGFALVAYPVDWQSSGVMTFQVAANGKVYQKDLGEKTAEIASKIEAFDIDPSWTLVKD
jgi:hypothetical protein